MPTDKIDNNLLLLQGEFEKASKDCKIGIGLLYFDETHCAVHCTMYRGNERFLVGRKRH